MKVVTKDYLENSLKSYTTKVVENKITPEWTGTTAELEAAKDTIEAGTICNVTDDYNSINDKMYYVDLSIRDGINENDIIIDTENNSTTIEKNYTKPVICMYNRTGIESPSSSGYIRIVTDGRNIYIDNIKIYSTLTLTLADSVESIADPYLLIPQSYIIEKFVDKYGTGLTDYFTSLFDFNSLYNKKVEVQSELIGEPGVECLAGPQPYVSVDTGSSTWLKFSCNHYISKIYSAGTYAYASLYFGWKAHFIKLD